MTIGSGVQAACGRFQMGEPPFKSALEMVNSVRIALTGAQTPTFLRAGLCAPDRSDIPAGLPAGRRLGVWCIGLYPDNATEKATASFSTAAVTIRYDAARVKAGERLLLFRYQAGVWRKVGESGAGEKPLIATGAPLSRLTETDYNIGWFALIAPDGAGLSVACR